MKGTLLLLEPKGTILEVARAAKKRGLRTVALTSQRQLIDLAPMPYRTAIGCIDEIIEVPGWESATDILAIAESLNATDRIVGVYAGMDPCATSLAALRARFSLPTPRAEDVAVVLNKFELRRTLRSSGLSNLKNYSAEEVESWTTWVPNRPVYFKPVHGFFSAYVRRCENLEELQSAIAAWKRGSDADPEYVRRYLRSSDTYHVEDAFDGELLSVESLSNGGAFKPLGLLSRILFSRDPVVEMGSCFPYPHPLKDQIIAKVEKAHQALSLTDGPSHTEVIVAANGEVEIIDLNPRFVGADVLQSINHAFGIAIEEHLLDFALGLPYAVNLNAERFSCLQYFLPPEVEELTSVNVPSVPEVPFSATFVEQGTKIQNTNRQLDYLGCYLTVMPTFQSAIERSKELRKQVVVNCRHQGVY